MSESEQAAEPERRSPLDRLVERSPIAVGAVAAAVALIAMIGWPWQVFVVLHLAIGWLALGLAGIALIALARGRRNAGAIAAIVVGVAGFAFWIAGPNLIGPLPYYAYVVTAVLLLGAGLVVGRVDPARRRGVFVASAGAVVFTIVGAFSALGG